jgi:hypothetical protein
MFEHFLCEFYHVNAKSFFWRALFLRDGTDLSTYTIAFHITQAELASGRFEGDKVRLE